MAKVDQYWVPCFKIACNNVLPLSLKSSNPPSVPLLTLQVMSFQLSQRPDLPLSVHKFTSPLIAILGITARLKTTYHMMSSDKGFIN